ncbi:MAG: glycosyltransferase family 2 protein [Bacteroidetes bacterium]|nr:glycosyltransferase family 2 protein [Bacteroidota bacterium]
MISVVIPLYNKEHFIAQTITSVLEQTYTQFELIVVNDGSTDGSADVISTIKSDKLKVVSIENSGVSEARNVGVRLASSPWVALLDADDWWAPTYLESVVKAIKDYPDEHVFATGRSRVFKKLTERYHHELLPKDGETAKLNYFNVISKYLPLVNSSNVCFRKSHFEKTKGFRIGQKKHEDHDLWMRLCINTDVVFINSELSFYRKTEEDTGSSRHYEADDFITYLGTLLFVNDRLKGPSLEAFKKYANQFVLLTYIKYYGNYKAHEEQRVYTLAKKLTYGNRLRILKMLRAIPFKGTYKLFKVLKH